MKQPQAPQDFYDSSFVSPPPSSSRQLMESLQRAPRRPQYLRTTLQPKWILYSNQQSAGASDTESQSEELARPGYVQGSLQELMEITKQTQKLVEAFNKSLKVRQCQELPK
jgi:hypothetical protein